MIIKVVSVILKMYKFQINGGTYMNSFIDYIEASCRGLKDNRMTYLYKRRLLDEMTARANEITHAGLSNEGIITDLIISEYGDLEKGYTLFEKEEKKRRFYKRLPLIGIVALVLILAAFFAVSAATGAWSKTWLIIVGGVFALITFYAAVAVEKLCTMSIVFHPIARVLVAGCVMIFSVFVFLFWLMMLPAETILWPVLPGGVALALAADLAFSYRTRQKFRTISFFVYMPIIATMLYIILAAYGLITWTAGWPVILLGLIVDVGYIIAVIISNMKYFMYKQEVDE